MSNPARLTLEEWAASLVGIDMDKLATYGRYAGPSVGERERHGH